jgi:hypothetical protein
MKLWQLNDRAGDLLNSLYLKLFGKSLSHGFFLLHIIKKQLSAQISLIDPIKGSPLDPDYQEKSRT